VTEPAQPDGGSGEWYADGLRFACTRCGNCCTGPPGAVWFTPDEGRAMAEKLGLDERTFYKRHAHRIDGAWSLKERRTEHGYDCIVLQRHADEPMTGCAVHAARPMQCRTWPFWPELLSSPKAWTSAKLTTPCPGMDNGPLIGIEQIRIQRDALRS
jgi:Fe-S-cluster containining protein